MLSQEQEQEEEGVFPPLSFNNHKSFTGPFSVSPPKIMMLLFLNKQKMITLNVRYHLLMYIMELVLSREKLAGLTIEGSRYVYFVERELIQQKEEVFLSTHSSRSFHSRHSYSHRNRDS